MPGFFSFFSFSSGAALLLVLGQLLPTVALWVPRQLDLNRRPIPESRAETSHPNEEKAS